MTLNEKVIKSINEMGIKIDVFSCSGDSHIIFSKNDVDFEIYFEDENESEYEVFVEKNGKELLRKNYTTIKGLNNLQKF